MFKDRLKTYRGKYTDEHVERISKGRGVLNEMIVKLDQHINYHPPSGRYKDRMKIRDVRLLVGKLKDEKLLQQLGERSHSPSLNRVFGNPTSGINGKSFGHWMEERMEMCRVRHYYQQFNIVPPSYIEDSALSTDHPFLSDLAWRDRPI